MLVNASFAIPDGMATSLPGSRTHRATITAAPMIPIPAATSTDMRITSAASPPAPAVTCRGRYLKSA